MKEIIRDATVYGTNYVTVVEIMGRNAGWLTAAASLAKSDDCEGVDMICLPKSPSTWSTSLRRSAPCRRRSPAS